MRSWIAIGLLLAAPARVEAVELVTLSTATWPRLAPSGKEADAIHGDFALANGQILAVVAQPAKWRHANMTVRDVGGAIIDLTRRDRPNDQLSAYYPGAQPRPLLFGGIDVVAPEVYDVAELDRVVVRARRVALRMVAAPREGEADITVTYALEDGWAHVTVTTRFTNSGKKPLEVDLADTIRADRSFEFTPPGASELYWAYDRHFRQAYGFIAKGHRIRASAGRAQLLRYENEAGKSVARLEPGQSYVLERNIVPAASTFAVRAVADQLAGKPARAATVVVQSKGQPVAGADVTLTREGAPALHGRANRQGRLEVDLGVGAASLTVSEPAHGKETREIAADAQGTLAFELPEAGRLAARITDEAGAPIPCKVQFAGRDGTPDPDFGPDGGEHAVRNLYYSHDGRFRVDLAPGRYEAIVSYGPEYDAAFLPLEITRGAEARLEAKLARSVKTEGWISSDFHSHSSPSGDNTSSQFGRVLNLLCEHIEFAPCTEHNRVSSYTPHLRRLGVESRTGTCPGIELTGSPLPINHQNAFPMVMRPHTQDGGGPTNDADPEVQIERLALWDAGADKLVQVNHPDIGWMFFDRDGDGKPDKGYSGMLGRMDVLEVHPPDQIFAGPTMTIGGRSYNNTIHNWLQLLNQGRRIPGVVNTDAHYNFHGSGWLRNYLKSPTDDPAAIKPLDVVHAAERGQVVMSNGPFLEVKAVAHTASAGPGEDLRASGGEVTLQVRVQCPNWLDVDRVGVFVNGKPLEAHDYTRAKTPDRFGAGVVKFDQRLALRLDGDAHVIVATIGEKSVLGRVMGPEHAKDKPVAVSNPIFVDVDGGGFTANRDTLGTLPVKAGR